MSGRNYEIFWDYKRGESQASLARYHKVTPARIRQIVQAVQHERACEARQREVAFLSSAVPEYNWLSLIPRPLLRRRESASVNSQQKASERCMTR